MKKKELRLKFTPDAYAILTEYRDRMDAEMREVNWSKVVNEIVTEYDRLVRRYDAADAPLSCRSSRTRETVDEKYKEKNV